ncbi:hypothetical protein ABZ547_43545 [Streptomyces sparsogenes]|uniref:hypothetical protein n=1 Tax=Streptomyces sparsogenes TaxID=67365 RepID=UPI0033FD7E10
MTEYKGWAWSTAAVATAALTVEFIGLPVIGWLASWTVAETAAPDSIEGGESPALFGFVLPFFSVFAVAAALIGAVLLILPTASLARWAGSRFGAGEAWWWVLPAALVLPAGVVMAIGVWAWLVGDTVSALWVYLFWWLALTALIIPAALLARLAARRAEAGRPVRLVKKILGGGCLGTVAFATVLVAAAIVLGA